MSNGQFFLYLFFTEASKRNVPSSKSAMLVIRYLTLRWRDDNEDVVKKAIGLQGKTTTLQVHHTFSFISFYWGRKQARTKIYFFFWTWKGILAIQLQRFHLLLKKKMVRNNRNKGWKNLNSLFKWRFSCHRLIGSLSPYFKFKSLTSIQLSVFLFWNPSIKEFLWGAFHSNQSSEIFGWYIKWNVPVCFGLSGTFRTSFVGTPLQNALRMSTKFNIRSAFYFRCSV